MTLVTVNNKMQKDYTYELTRPMGDLSDLDFTPYFTPAEMLSQGIMGGLYFNSSSQEYPDHWFNDTTMSPTYDKTLNKFGVFSGLTLAEWRLNNWINPQDPRGWIEWYFRTYMGRRSPDDSRQCGRHRAIARHRGGLLSGIRRNPERKGDATFSPVRRQALLHWSWNPFPELEQGTIEQ